MPALLELASIVTFRGPAEILRGLTMTIAPGEAVVLVGRNGAGKTTTIDSIMGLLPVRSGRVTFKGQDVTRLPAHVRARLGVGYAPEDTGIFPDLTVEENFEIARWLAQSGTARATSPAEVFAIFPEVKEFLGRRGLNLSGGQKKMVAITRAMMLRPAVLLLDEPFEGLAPIVVTRFIEAVKAIKGLGISLLIAESHVTNAARIADRLYAIDRGEIIFQGPPAEALRNREVMQTISG